jgi:hypothetical protein
MVRVPAVDDEDRRRIGRERKALIEERKRHVNRINGLLFGVGIRHYEPVRRDRRERLEKLRPADGRPLPTRPRHSFIVNWTGLSCWMGRSRPSKPNAMPCARKPMRPRLKRC